MDSSLMMIIRKKGTVSMQKYKPILVWLKWVNLMQLHLRLEKDQKCNQQINFLYPGNFDRGYRGKFLLINGISLLYKLIFFCLKKNIIQ